MSEDYRADPLKSVKATPSSDFTQATRSRTTALPFANGNEIFEVATGLLATVYPFKRSVRLLGVTLSSLSQDRQEDNDQDQSQLDFGM